MPLNPQLTKLACQLAMLTPYLTLDENAALIFHGKGTNFAEE